MPPERANDNLKCVTSCPPDQHLLRTPRNGGRRQNWRRGTRKNTHVQNCEKSPASAPPTNTFQARKVKVSKISTNDHLTAASEFIESPTSVMCSSMSMSGGTSEKHQNAKSSLLNVEDECNRDAAQKSTEVIPVIIHSASSPDIHCSQRGNNEPGGIKQKNDRLNDITYPTDVKIVSSKNMDQNSISTQDRYAVSADMSKEESATSNASISRSTKRSATTTPASKGGSNEESSKGLKMKPFSKDKGELSMSAQQAEESTVTRNEMEPKRKHEFNVRAKPFKPAWAETELGHNIPDTSNTWFFGTESDVEEQRRRQLGPQYMPPYHVLDLVGSRGIFLMPGHVPVKSLAEKGLVLPMPWMKITDKED